MLLKTKGCFQTLHNIIVIPAFAAMTAVGGAHKSKDVTPAEAGVHVGQAPYASSHTNSSAQPLRGRRLTFLSDGHEGVLR